MVQNVGRGESPLELLKNFLECYIIKRDETTIADYFAKDFFGFGAGEFDRELNRDKLIDYLKHEMSDNQLKYQIEILMENERNFSRGCGNANIKFRLISKDVNSIFRISITTCLENDIMKICSMHFSMPYKDTKKNDFFPHNLAEKHARELTEDYLKRASLYGVLSGYNEPGFPFYYINDRMLQMLGFESAKEYEESIDHLIENGMYEKDRKEVNAEVAKQLEANGEYLVTYRMLRKDGSYIWVDDYGKRIEAEDKKTVIVSICLDVSERIGQHQRLEQRNNELKNVVNSLTGGIAKYQISDQIICDFFTDGLAEMLEYTPNEFLEICKRDLHQLMYEGDQVIVDSAIEKLIHDHVSTTVAFRIRKKNNLYIWVRVNINYSGDIDGIPTVYAIYSNLTKETALYQDALDQTNDIILICDAKSKEILYLNQAAANFRKQQKTDALGQKCYDLITDYGAECPFCPLKDLDYDELKIREMKWGDRFCQVKAKRLIWNGREAIIEYVSDITDAHKASAKVKRDRDMLISATRVMFPMCISVNLTQNSYYMIEYDNFNAKKADREGIFDELIEVGLSTIYDEDKESFEKTFARENLLKAYEAGKKVVSLVARQYDEEGNIHWNRTTVVFYEDSYSGDICEITLTDCLDDQKEIERNLRKQELELKKALKEVQRANNTKSDFLARMSHDMRTPMNSILGLISISLDEIDNKMSIMDNLTKMKLASDFMLGLINDILDRAKIDEGTFSIKEAPYSYQAILDNLYTMFAPMCIEKEIRFEFEKMATGLYVIIDHIRLNQIFFNILSNAVKYTPRGGCVSFQVKNFNLDSERMSCDYIIKDTGIGMSQSFQQHMYEPFVQEESKITYEMQGSGLGLSITKNLVELMNGTINIKSKQGKGTTVTVHLSFKVAKSEEVKKQRIEDAIANEVVLQNKNILLVEDHPLNASIAKKLLEKRHMNVICAENGAVAVELFNKMKNGYFDLILMDIRMPVMDGLEATKKIRALDRIDAKEIPIVAMTANAYDEDREKSREAGMVEHLAKPIEPDKLYQVLAKYLGGEEITKRKILIIDDVKINIAVIESVLKEEFTLISASDGVEALEVLEENKDVIMVITDIQMPNMDGIELIKHIRVQPEYNELAIIANTQYGEPSQEEELLEIGADDFLYKPSSPMIITNRVKSVLRKYQ